MEQLLVAGGLGTEGGISQDHSHSIPHYHGTLAEHPKVPGLYMRSGHGVQHWDDGRVYSGQWENHCYHGEGALWRSSADYRAGLGHASYRGQWLRGRRHGHGYLRFEQRCSSGQCRVRTYEGQFDDDLFSGKGHLSVEGTDWDDVDLATTRSLAPPHVDLAKLLSFEGSFSSSLPQALAAVGEGPQRQGEPHGLGTEFRLEELSQADGAMLAHYFGAGRGSLHGRLQGAGAPMPDLAAAYYALEGRDVDAIQGAGRMRFTDGSEYSGGLLRGLPEGEGELVQRSRELEERRGEDRARYSGQWHRGQRHGRGTYVQQRGFVYEGAWLADQRHGDGVQTVSPALEATFGYLRYDGQWAADMQHGSGRAFRTGKVEDVYSPEAGLRTVFKDVIVYSGGWIDGMVSAPDSQPCWVHLVPRHGLRGRYYFGPISAEGLRAGKLGFLYAEDAHEDEEFHHAMRTRRPFLEDPRILEVLAAGGDVAPQVPGGLRLTLYAGAWEEDKPHGIGFQNFTDLGTYVGEFAHGLRHGRGMWITRDGSLRYRPADATSRNWENDKMHGLATIEDATGCHENISYNQGMCRTWRRGLRAVDCIREAPIACPTMDFEDPQVLRSLARARRPATGGRRGALHASRLGRGTSDGAG